MQPGSVASGVWPVHEQLAAADGSPPVEAAVPAPSPVVVKLFRTTVRSQGAALFGRAVGLTRDAEEARDLVQDTLLKALASLHVFGAGTNMNAWLMKIMLNLFIDGYRRRAARPQLVPLCEKALEMGPPHELDPGPPSARISSEQLHHALADLNPLFRDAYQLRIVEKLSYQQIALRLGIPSSTVGTRLRRARQELRRVLTAAEESGIAAVSAKRAA